MNAVPVRINYPLDKVGVKCLNKRLLAKIHDTSFQEMSPSMFSDKNLKRASVKYTAKTNERTTEEVWFASFVSAWFYNVFFVLGR